MLICVRHCAQRPARAFWATARRVLGYWRAGSEGGFESTVVYSKKSAPAMGAEREQVDKALENLKAGVGSAVQAFIEDLIGK